MESKTRSTPPHIFFIWPMMYEDCLINSAVNCQYLWVVSHSLATFHINLSDILRPKSH